MYIDTMVWNKTEDQAVNGQQNPGFKVQKFIDGCELENLCPANGMMKRKPFNHSIHTGLCYFVPVSVLGL